MAGFSKSEFSKPRMLEYAMSNKFVNRKSSVIVVFYFTQKYQNTLQGISSKYWQINFD